MDAPTMAQLRAAVEAADAEVAQLKAELIVLDKEIARLEAEKRAAESLRTALYNPWSRSGKLATAESKAKRAREALANAGRPTLPVSPTYSSGPKVARIEQFGAVQMRTNVGMFRRQADGSWLCSYTGTIAPFDEAAVRAQVKAAKGGAS